MSLMKLATSALALSAMAATTAMARDQVQIAGSSTVLPYASIVAEAFGENSDFPTPVVESGGSSSGLKRFCEGVGENTIDIANASRAIREKEIKACAEAGVTEIIEVRIGYDGIVFASQIDGPAYTAFQPADIFNALGSKVLVDGAIVDNPHSQWAISTRTCQLSTSWHSSPAPSTAPAKYSRTQCCWRAVKLLVLWKR